MTKEKILIVYRDDPKLKLEKLVQMLGSQSSILVGSTSQNGIYKNLSTIAEGRNAEIALIDKETKEQLKVSFYKNPGVNLYHPDELFDGTFGTDFTNKKYSIARSLEYVLSKK